MHLDIWLTKAVSKVVYILLVAEYRLGLRARPWYAFKDWFIALAFALQGASHG